MGIHEMLDKFKTHEIINFKLMKEINEVLSRCDEIKKEIKKKKERLRIYQKEYSISKNKRVLEVQNEHVKNKKKNKKLKKLVKHLSNEIEEMSDGVKKVCESIVGKGASEDKDVNTILKKIEEKLKLLKGNRICTMPNSESLALKKTLVYAPSIEDIKVDNNENKVLELEEIVKMAKNEGIVNTYDFEQTKKRGKKKISIIINQRKKRLSSKKRNIL